MTIVLPGEILVEIFAFLLSYEVRKCKDICKSWKSLIEANERCLPQQLVEETIEFLNTGAYLKKLNPDHGTGKRKQSFNLIPVKHSDVLYCRICELKLSMEKADMNMKSQTLEKVIYKCQKRLTASFLQIKIWTIQVLLSRPTFLNDSFECSCLIMEIYLTDKREAIDHIIKRPEIFHIEESRCKSIHLKITTGVTFIEATREQLVNFIFDQEAYENRDFLKICLNTMELVPLVRRIFEKFFDIKFPSRVFKLFSFDINTINAKHDYLLAHIRAFENMNGYGADHDRITNSDTKYYFTTRRTDGWALQLIYVRNQVLQFRVIDEEFYNIFDTYII